MRNKIRLNESQLHQVIKESVKKILSELDWKTYASAEDKARKRDTGYWRGRGVGYPDCVSKAGDSRRRAERFASAAKDAFNRDFGYSNNKNYVRMGGDFDKSEEFGPHAIGMSDGGYYSGGLDYNDYTVKTPEEFFYDDVDAANAYNRANDEIKRYKKGDAHYTKGKGWD